MTIPSLPHSVQLLLVEDSLADAVLLRELLREQDAERYSIHHVTMLADAKAYLAAHEMHVVLLDLSLPDGFGLQSVRAVRAVAPDLPIIVLTGMANEELAVQTLQEGVEDYLLKQGIDGRLLERAIRYAIERKQAELVRMQLLREQAARYEAEVAQLRTQILVEASTILASSLDYEQTLAQVVQLVVPTLAEWCAIDIIEQSGQRRSVGVAAANSEHMPLVHALLERLSLSPTTLTASMLATGEPVYLADMVDSERPAWIQDEELFQILRRLHFRSGMAVPLQVRGQIMGIFRVGACEGNFYGKHEQAFVTELA